MSRNVRVLDYIAYNRKCIALLVNRNTSLVCWGDAVCASQCSTLNTRLTALSQNLVTASAAGDVSMASQESVRSIACPDRAICVLTQVTKRVLCVGEANEGGLVPDEVVMCLFTRGSWAFSYVFVC